MAEDFTLGVEPELDDAEAQRQAERLADIFADAFQRAAPGIGQDLARQINVAFSRTTTRGPSLAERVVGDTDAIRREARQVADAAGNIGGSFQEAGREISAGLGIGESKIDELRNGVIALEQRAEATKRALSQVGADPQLFAVIDNSLKRVQSSFRQLNQQLDSGFVDQDLLRGLETSLEQGNKTIFREVGALQSILKTLTTTQRVEGNRLNEQASRQAQERLQDSRSANARYIVEQQGQNAQLLADTRISGQRENQARQAAARTRIEIVRFTFRQIQVLERGIAGLFRASGTAAQAAARTTSAALGRIGGLFRRSNRQLNDGLNGALLARERSIDRSFERQTADIRGSLREQTVLIDRFERQASTGLVGAATGRSGLGRLFGVGAGIGGGFLVARQLREGFDESVRLGEALNAVEVIAGDAADSIIEFSEKSVEALFVTQSAALQAGVEFTSFGKVAGIQGEELATFSNVLTQLATDLASFRDTSVEQAINAITSGLAGESEPLKRFSVFTQEANLRQRALAAGITDTNRKLTQQERILAVYAELLASTTDAQGDAARTSEDFANASKQAGAAVTELFAAVIGRLKPVGESILLVLNPALIRLTEIIEGELSPTLKIFRDALIGVAVALGALLVAKAAGEALQFFAIGLRAAITPLGLVIVGVAAAGAAIGIFSQRSERFADILRGVVRGLRELAGRGVELALQGLSAVGQLLTNVVLPALQQFGRVIAGPVLRGLEIAIGFIVNVAVPAFTRLAMLLVDNIVPALQAVGRFLTGTVVPALSAFGQVAIGVLSSVVSFLEPAIRGFQALGDAIVLAFRTGDLSGLLGGLQAVAVGIGQVFGNLGMLIFDALRPQVERAVRFISSAFDRIDFAAIGLQILEVVRLIGFVLGSIVSDPRFLTAVAAVAAAAVAVGVKFVQGFAQGVISNLPELGRLIGSALQRVVEEAISFAFSNPATIGKIILAGFAASAILRAYSTAGSQGARALSAGFVGGLRAAPGRAVDVANGLFGGQGGLNDAVARNARLAAERTQRTFSRTLRDIGRLGGSTAGLFPNGIIRDADVRRAQTQLRNLEASIGQTQASTRLLRQRTVEAFGGIRTAIGQTARALTPGLTGSFVRARAGASQALTAISDGFARAQAQGKLSGAALGNSVLAGFGAVISGQQLGGGNTALGLSGILASSLAAGLATGLPAIGVAVGAVGLLTAAFTANKDAARNAAREIGEYTSALEDAASFSEQVAGAAETVFENIRNENAGTQDLLLQLGFNYRQFAEDVISGTFDANDAIATLAPAFGDASADFVARSGILANVLGSVEGGVEAAALEFEKFLPAGATVRDVTEAFDALNDESSELRSGLAEAGRAAQFKELAGDTELVAQGIQTFTDQVTGANDELVRLGESNPYVEIAKAAADANEGVGGLLGDLGAGIRAIYEQASLPLNFDIDAAVADLLSLLDLGGQVEDQFKGFGIDAFTDEYLGAGLSISDINRQIADSTSDAAEETDIYTDALDTLLGALGGVTDEAEEAAEGLNLTKAAVTELNQVRTSRIRGEIERIRSQLDDAREAADRARDALTSFITSRYANTAQASVDALIGNIGNIGSEIEDALLQGGVRGEAALRGAVGGFEQQLAGIIQAGFDDGLRTQEEFRRLLAPLFAALDDEVGDSAGRILSTTDFEFGITDRAGTSLRDSLTRALAGRQIEVGAQTLINAEAEVSRIEELLNAQQAQMDVEVVFDANQIANALAVAGASAAQIAAATDPAAIVAAYQTGLDAAVAAQPGPAVTGANAGQFPIEVTPPPVVVNVIGEGEPVPSASATVVASRRATSGRIRVPGTPF